MINGTIAGGKIHPIPVHIVFWAFFFWKESSHLCSCIILVMLIILLLILISIIKLATFVPALFLWCLYSCISTFHVTNPSAIEHICIWVFSRQKDKYFPNYSFNFIFQCFFALFKPVFVPMFITSLGSVTINHDGRTSILKAQPSIDQAIFWTAIWPTYHISWNQQSSSNFLCCLHATPCLSIIIHHHSASTRLLLPLLLYLPCSYPNSPTFSFHQNPPSFARLVTVPSHALSIPIHQNMSYKYL